MKCETPARVSDSSREPAPIQKPSAIERTPGTRSEMTRSPVLSSVSWCFDTPRDGTAGVFPIQAVYRTSGRLLGESSRAKGRAYARPFPLSYVLKRPSYSTPYDGLADAFVTDPAVTTSASPQSVAGDGALLTSPLYETVQRYVPPPYVPADPM